MISTFIGYASEDKSIAKRVARDLASKGISVWLDQDEILVGDSVSERIRQGIFRCDYLIVLLSARSRDSIWVTGEIGAAFARFGKTADRAILPVRIDDSPLPAIFADARCVDLSKDYEQAIAALVARMTQPDVVRQLASIVDADDLADDMASERTIPRGREFYVTSLLALLSVVATMVAAWPAFHDTFRQGARVYYDVEAGQVSLPPGADEEKILRALEGLNVAPAGLRVRVVNKGTTAASEVKLGAECEGSFQYATTQPAVGAKSVWVETELSNFSPGDREVVVLLKNLVPERTVVVDLGYSPREVVVSCDVVANGILAEKVRNIDALPTWSLWEALSTPLQVLGGGLVITLFVGVVLAARRNPRVRVKLVDLLDAVVPMFGRILRILTK